MTQQNEEQAHGLYTVGGGGGGRGGVGGWGGGGGVKRG